jgi:hypothetical protein
MLIRLFFMILFGVILVGCHEDIPAKPKPSSIGHVETTKIDGLISKIEIRLDKCEYHISNRQEAEVLAANFQTILNDLKFAVDEMKSSELEPEPNAN